MKKESRVEPDRDPNAGQWIASRLLPWWSLPNGEMPVGAIVPSGFARYARILHPAYAKYPERRSVRWRDVANLAGSQLLPDTTWVDIDAGLQGAGIGANYEAPEYGTLPQEELRTLVEILRAHTATPGDCHFALWDGYGGLDYDGLWPGATRLQLPGRTYVCLKGPIEAAIESFDEEPFWQSPNLWWPGDRRWCVATEIDYCWTYVGGNANCIQALLRSPRLEALAVSAEDIAVNPWKYRDGGTCLRP